MQTFRNEPDHRAKEERDRAEKKLITGQRIIHVFPPSAALAAFRRTNQVIQMQLS